MFSKCTFVLRSEFELLFACTHAVQTTSSVFEVHVRITKRIRGERSCYFTVVCMHSCFDGRILSRWVYTQKVMPKTQNMSKNMFEIGKMGT